MMNPTRFALSVTMLSCAFLVACGAANAPQSPGADAAAPNSFAVNVEVTGPEGRSASKLTQAISAEVTVVGAVSEPSVFLLDNFPRWATYPYETQPDGQLLLASFRYETTMKSGSVTFTVDLHNGTNGPDGVIASGSRGADIQAGGTVDVLVAVTPRNFAD